MSSKARGGLSKREYAAAQKAKTARISTPTKSYSSRSSGVSNAQIAANVGKMSTNSYNTGSYGNPYSDPYGIKAKQTSYQKANPTQSYVWEGDNDKSSKKKKSSSKSSSSQRTVAAQALPTTGKVLGATTSMIPTKPNLTWLGQIASRIGQVVSAPVNMGYKAITGRNLDLGITENIPGMEEEQPYFKVPIAGMTNGRPTPIQNPLPTGDNGVNFARDLAVAKATGTQMGSPNRSMPDQVAFNNPFIAPTNVMNEYRQNAETPNTPVGRENATIRQLLGSGLLSSGMFGNGKGDYGVQGTLGTNGNSIQDYISSLLGFNKNQSSWDNYKSAFSRTPLGVGVNLLSKTPGGKGIKNFIEEGRSLDAMTPEEKDVWLAKELSANRGKQPDIDKMMGVAMGVSGLENVAARTAMPILNRIAPGVARGLSRIAPKIGEAVPEMAGKFGTALETGAGKALNKVSQKLFKKEVLKLRDESNPLGMRNYQPFPGETQTPQEEYTNPEWDVFQKEQAAKRLAELDNAETNPENLRGAAYRAKYYPSTYTVDETGTPEGFVDNSGQYTNFNAENVADYMPENAIASGKIALAGQGYTPAQNKFSMNGFANQKANFLSNNGMGGGQGQFGSIPDYGQSGFTSEAPLYLTQNQVEGLSSPDPFNITNINPNATQLAYAPEETYSDQDFMRDDLANMIYQDEGNFNAGFDDSAYKAQEKAQKKALKELLKSIESQYSQDVSKGTEEMNAAKQQDLLRLAGMFDFANSDPNDEQRVQYQTRTTNDYAGRLTDLLNQLAQGRQQQISAGQQNYQSQLGTIAQARADAQAQMKRLAYQQYQDAIKNKLAMARLYGTGMEEEDDSGYNLF